MSTLMEHIERSMRAASAEHRHLVERAFDDLERNFGISRDRVDERGNLEVTPEEFANMRATAIKLEGFEERNVFSDFQINVIVVNPEAMCDRTLECPANTEHFLSCHADPWKVAR